MTSQLQRRVCGSVLIGAGCFAISLIGTGFLELAGVRAPITLPVEVIGFAAWLPGPVLLLMGGIGTILHRKPRISAWLAVAGALVWSGLALYAAVGAAEDRTMGGPDWGTFTIAIVSAALVDWASYWCLRLAKTERA